MIKNIQGLMVILFSATLLLIGCQANNGEGDEQEMNIELTSDMLTLLTSVQPYGEVVDGVAIDLGEEINETELANDSFQVVLETEEGQLERTIVSVYTHNELGLSEQPSSGEYLIIELDSDDEEAGTLIYDEEAAYNTRQELNYALINEAVEIDGNTILAGPEEGQQIETQYQTVVEDFQHHEFTSSTDQHLDYYLFEPDLEEEASYPLIVFLHGNGERGAGNQVNLLGNEGAVVWARPEQQSQNPAYVLAPQAPIDGEEFFIWGDEPRNSTVKELVDATVEDYPIDQDRIYIVGISQGAIGTWRLIENYPSFFAAAVPIAGTTHFEAIDDDNIAPVDQEHLDTYFDMPIWAFHAADDFVVTPDNIRELAELADQHDATTFNYTEYEEETILPIGHFSWVPALQDQEMKTWLFEQSK
ncbi:PHB depolymerase family esterase [Amphibacillus jilinensis]|uniref:PHB depolymerase family esterase n=1 Tax=Amphibacillus jilinensis TaxID=1216008 RepID=UPI0002F3479B|nr:PHB depolymerase family esterase [Amphibacillus jilinensis]